MSNPSITQNLTGTDKTNYNCWKCSGIHKVGQQPCQSSDGGSSVQIWT